MLSKSQMSVRWDKSSKGALRIVLGDTCSWKRQLGKTRSWKARYEIGKNEVRAEVGKFGLKLKSTELKLKSTS